jgi:hypothetical protein
VSDRFSSGQLLVLRPADTITVRNPDKEAVRIVLIGGDDERITPYPIELCFVATRTDRTGKGGLSDRPAGEHFDGDRNVRIPYSKFLMR